ncbi:MAG: RelA/SpoT family protein [Patescibacteria group bacterium]
MVITYEAFIALLKKQNRPFEHIGLLEQSYAFAARAHKTQKRKSGAPYIEHPLTTAYRLAELELDQDTIAAALLHDVCEDSGVDPATIRAEFGDDVAFLVGGVTKLDKIKYHGVRRHAESLRRMFLAIGEDMRIVLIKLFDRLHNMETLKYLPPEKQKRIAAETLDIYAPLAYRLGIGELSGKLEDLAFPYVYPDEYAWVVRTAKNVVAENERYIERIKPQLTGFLQRENVPFLDISARAKRYYSIYKKLLKYDMDMAKLTDLIALRIIVPTIEDCYTTLGVIHKSLPPVPGKIKDYIALPKANGYRSLHTTVFGPDQQYIEIQLRTPEMHEEAELGIAAYWHYAETKKESGGHYVARRPTFVDQERFSWIQQLREWQKDFQSPNEFIESLKIDFFKDRVFALTPKGDVLDLPDGGTPVDFAYKIHTDIGHATVGAKVNGSIVPLHYHIKNGDVVQILTQKGKNPSADWLSFAKSPETKKKIAAHLAKKRGSESVMREKTGYSAEVRIAVDDRTGILRDISHVFAHHRVNMTGVTTDRTNRHYPLVVIQAQFKDAEQLDKIIFRLMAIKGIKEIHHRAI